MELENDIKWDLLVEKGLDNFLQRLAYQGFTSKEHIAKTPERFTKALRELFSGTLVDPKKVLSTKFTAKNMDEMIHIHDMTFFSVCAHHLLPFFGKAHFAYIPDEHIIGLSKIPRLLEGLARRPQVQEELSNQLVEVFQEELKPKGCAVCIRAYHMCCTARGVRQPTSYMQTTALRGIFKDQDSTKQEFLLAANSQTDWKMF